jgi:hypothetical protein
VKLTIAKQRNGPVGDVSLVFRPALTRFESAELAVFATGERAKPERRI